MYVIRVTNHLRSGWYVAPAGRHSAYVPFAKNARKFPSFEAASAECCGNEYPVRYEP